MKPKPIASLDEYRAAVEALLAALLADDRLRGVALDIERVVRFENEYGIRDAGRLSARLMPSAQPRGRRVALISDIHGHHAGLRKVLDDIEHQRCDRIVCLGDLVDGGPENERVIETLLGLGVPCVRGNHDEVNDLALSSEWQRFLRELPEHIVEGDVLYTHISPRPIRRKIDHTVEAWNTFDETSYRLVFIGHVHIPYIFGERSTSYGEATRHAFEYNRPFELAPDDHYIVSVGSVGYGRDQVGKLRYAIHDRSAGTVELRAIDGPLLPLDYTLR